MRGIDNLGNYVNITPKFSNNTFRNGGNTIHLKVYNTNLELKIKYLNEKGSVRIENDVEIKEVLVRENLVDPEKKKISIGFTNDYSSGLIEFSPAEFDRLMKSAKDKVHLIKGMKVIKG